MEYGEWKDEWKNNKATKNKDDGIGRQLSLLPSIPFRSFLPYILLSLFHSFTLLVSFSTVALLIPESGKKW